MHFLGEVVFLKSYRSVDQIYLGPDECTPEEAEKLRLRLHQIGADKFVLETVTTGLVSARKLCTAFGIRPFIFDGQPDEACYQLLGLLIARELSKRQPLPQYKTIDDAAQLLKTCKNIIVITGAGVSLFAISFVSSNAPGYYLKLNAKDKQFLHYVHLLYQSNAFNLSLSN